MNEGVCIVVCICDNVYVWVCVYVDFDRCLSNICASIYTYIGYGIQTYIYIYIYNYVYSDICVMWRFVLRFKTLCLFIHIHPHTYIHIRGICISVCVFYDAKRIQDLYWQKLVYSKNAIYVIYLVCICVCVYIYILISENISV